MTVCRPRDEEGAVAPLVAVMMVLLVGVASFAVDLGYQRVAARDMQAVADVVAIDLARGLDGRTTGQLLGSAWNARVAESLARNDDSPVGDELGVVSCTPAETGLSGAAKICATPGIYTPATGAFVDSGSQAATHVRVITRTRIDYFFPVFANDGWVSKSAYAEYADRTCIQVGSYVANGDLNAGVLGPLLGVLGTRLGIAVGDLESLAEVDVSLLGLLGAQVNGVSMSSLLGADVALGDYYLAIAEVARQERATAQAQLLELIAGRVSGLSLNLGDVLALGTGGTSGLNADVNVFDLVAAGLTAASGDAGLQLQSLNLNLLGVNATADLNLLQRPQIGCGKRRAANNPIVESSQLTAKVNLAVGVPSQLDALGALTALIEGLSLGLLDITVSAQVGVELKLVPARARLTGVDCVGQTRRVYLQVSGGRLVELSLTVKALVHVERVAILTGAKSTVAKVDVHVPVLTQPASPVWEPKTIDITSDADYDRLVSMGSGTVGLPEVNVGNATAIVQVGSLAVDLGLLANAVVAPVKWILTGSPSDPRDGLVGGLDTALLDPLLKLVGVDVAGFRVKVLRTPECGSPALRG